jgi:hypothetical protein
MGADTPRSAKFMIKDIDNCLVTDRDIDIANFIYGSYDALMGHSKLKKSLPIRMDLQPI